jgi:membrane protease YdiL (CAAX protease family)
MLGIVRAVFWNAKQRRIRATWRLLIFLAVTVGVGLPLLNAIDASDNVWLENSAEQPAVAIGVLLALLISTRYTDRRPFADFGLSLSRTWWRELGLGLAIGGLLMSLLFLVLYSAGWVTIEGFTHTDMIAIPFGVALLGQVLRYVGTGFFEEILLRGYLLRSIAEGISGMWISRRTAVLISWIATSALFGVLHLGNPNATLLVASNIVLAGLFFGFGMIYTGRLALPIGIHITWNFFQVSLFGLGSSGRSVNTSVLVTETRAPEVWAGGSFGPEGGLLSLAAFGLGTVALWLWIRRRTGDLRLRVSLADAPSCK